MMHRRHRSGDGTDPSAPRPPASAPAWSVGSGPFRHAWLYERNKIRWTSGRRMSAVLSRRILRCAVPSVLFLLAIAMYATEDAAWEAPSSPYPSDGVRTIAWAGGVSLRATSGGDGNAEGGGPSGGGAARSGGRGGGRKIGTASSDPMPRKGTTRGSIPDADRTGSKIGKFFRDDANANNETDTLIGMDSGLEIEIVTLETTGQNRTRNYSPMSQAKQKLRNNIDEEYDIGTGDEMGDSKNIFSMRATDNQPSSANNTNDNSKFELNKRSLEKRDRLRKTILESMRNTTVPEPRSTMAPRPPGKCTEGDAFEETPLDPWSPPRGGGTAGRRRADEWKRSRGDAAERIRNFTPAGGRPLRDFAAAEARALRRVRHRLFCVE